MWTEAELVFSAYKPLKIEKGMRFVRMDGEVPKIYEYDGSRHDRDDYMGVNGHPVELSLFEWSLNNPHFNQLATPSEIGWIDDGEDSDELREVTLDDLNNILRNRCHVQCHDSIKNMNVAVFDEEKVIIRLIEET